MSTTTEHATPARSRLGRLGAWAALVLLLALLAGFGVSRAMTSSGSSYKATQVLAIVPATGAATDGAVAAASQWSTVAASAPFRAQMASQTGRDVDDVTKALKVTPGTTDPTLSVAVTGTDEAAAQRLLTTASKALQAESKSTDARYPVKALTPTSVAKAKATSGTVPGLAASLVVLVAGAALIAMMARRAG